MMVSKERKKDWKDKTINRKDTSYLYSKERKGNYQDKTIDRKNISNFYGKKGSEEESGRRNKAKMKEVEEGKEQDKNLGKKKKKETKDKVEVKCAKAEGTFVKDKDSVYTRWLGAVRVMQKVLGSPKLLKSVVESESVVIKFVLVMVLAVSMYMFSVAEQSLQSVMFGNARWQDWNRALNSGDRHPSRKSLSKANCFRKRRHTRKRLALVGQTIKVMLFISMDTVHATQHGPENNPALAGTGPAASAGSQSPAQSAEHVFAQVLRQNTEALQKLAVSGSGSEVSRNLESASRILKNPDNFRSGDCTEAQFGLWKHQFSNWLTVGDDRFKTLLESAEGQVRESDMGDFSAEGKALSRKLHRLSITRAVRETENGFLVWQRLRAEYRPLSRQRGMALAQVLATYPAFPRDKSVMERILALEEVAHQYNQVTGEDYPKSLLMGTLTRRSPPQLRQHLQLTLQDTSTYRNVKETMLLYEKTTKAWSSESVLKEVGATRGSRQDEPSTRTLQRKGKGKGKSKTKGSQVGRHGVLEQEVPGKAEEEVKAKVEEKEKVKAKERKAKVKVKGKKGSKRGKGSKGNDRHRLCGQTGHWGNECPNRMVNQAESSTTAETASTHTPSSSSGNASNQDRRVIRQVKMFHMGTPPSTLPEAFEVCTSDEEIELQWCRMIQEFPLTESELPEGSPSYDVWHLWRDVELPGCNSDVQVRMVQKDIGHDDEWVILDSGADLSLLPQRLRSIASP